MRWQRGHFTCQKKRKLGQKEIRTTNQSIYLNSEKDTNNEREWLSLIKIKLED